MPSQDIIRKLKEAGLTGRGGAGFPAWKKWEAVKNAPGEKKYVICNAGEGEPGVFKDGFILKNHPEKIIAGIRIALETVGAESAYICLRRDYYEKFGKSLKKLSGDLPVRLFKKVGGYLGGEETALINSIEKKRTEPEEKPPFPSLAGLWGCPTLINNAETFYHVARINEGKYKKTRFYSLSGDIGKPGIYELPENLTIKNILKKTGNWPKSDFFVQAGGGASGEILTNKELNRSAGGQGAVIVYSKEKTNPRSLMKKWAEFYLKESCGKCVPCREGICRLSEELKKKEIDRKVLEDIFLSLKKSSYCGLGKNAAVPFKSLLKNFPRLEIGKK